MISHYILKNYSLSDRSLISGGSLFFCCFEDFFLFKYLANYISDKGTLSEIYKECLKLNKKKKNTIINESKSGHSVKGRYRCGK